MLPWLTSSKMATGELMKMLPVILALMQPSSHQKPGAVLLMRFSRR